MTSICSDYSFSNHPNFLEIKKREFYKKTGCAAAGVFLFLAGAATAVYFLLPHTKEILYPTLGISFSAGLGGFVFFAIQNYRKWKACQKTANLNTETQNLLGRSFQKVDIAESRTQKKQQAILSLENNDRVVFSYPNDTLRAIFSRGLTIRDFCRLSMTCKRINQFFQEDQLFWQLVLHNHFGISLPIEQDLRRVYRLLASYGEGIFNVYRQSFSSKEIYSSLIFKNQLFLKKDGHLEAPDGQIIEMRNKTISYPDFHATESFIFMGGRNCVEVYDASYQFLFELTFPDYDQMKNMQLPPPILTGRYYISYDREKLLSFYHFDLEKIYEIEKSILAIGKNTILLFDKLTGALQESHKCVEEIKKVIFHDQKIYLSFDKKIEIYDLTPNLNLLWTIEKQNFTLHSVVSSAETSYLISTTSTPGKSTLQIFTPDEQKNRQISLDSEHQSLIATNEKFICLFHHNRRNVTLEIYSVEAGQPLETIKIFNSHVLHAFIFHNFLIAATTNCIKIVDLETRTAVYSVRTFTEDYANISSLKIVNGQLVALVHHSSIRSWSELFIFDFGKFIDSRSQRGVDPSASAVDS